MPNPFINAFVEESVRKMSQHVLMDNDLNKSAHEILNCPIDISPKMFSPNKTAFAYQDPAMLLIYPSKSDIEEYLLKSEQLIEAIHGIAHQICFEIRGNKEKIECLFYGEKIDLSIIDSSIRNFFRHAVTDFVEQEIVMDTPLYIYDFLASSPFYKALTPFQNFVYSPLNLIAQLLLNIPKDQTGVYQVLIRPLKDCHSLVQQGIDDEWKSLQGSAQHVLPSLQITSKRLEHKNPEFKSYFSTTFRMILPLDLGAHIQGFISSYSYGAKGFEVWDNSHYSQEQIQEMFNHRLAYHSGMLVNSHELTSLLHPPMQIINDKTFDTTFQVAPAGDKPIKTAEYQDVPVGTWACGSTPKPIFLPLQKEIAHAHILGIPRMGKSVLLSHMVLEKLSRKEAVFVLDPHGDLVTSILRMIPKDRMDDVVVLDFGLKDFTPQITIRDNIDLLNPSKSADDLAEGMRDVTSGNEKFWGPRMSFYFTCLYYLYCIFPDMDLTQVRLLVSPSPEGKVHRKKIKALVQHPIVHDFLSEVDMLRHDVLAPVVTRLSHLLLDESSLRLLTQATNKISISEIMETGKICLVNLSLGVIGKQRSSILSGLMDSLINNNALARAKIPYEQRKPFLIIKDEFYLSPGDIDSQMSGLSKYGLSVAFANQYLAQVDGNTKEVMGTAGTRIVFKVRPEDAEILAKDFSITPLDLTSLKKFQAFLKIEDEVIKIDTPKPIFPEHDYSDEIMQNCLDKYYLRHDEPENKPRKKQLSFDKL